MFRTVPSEHFPDINSFNPYSTSGLQLCLHHSGLLGWHVHQEIWDPQLSRDAGFPRGSTYRDLYVLLVIFIKVVWKSIQGGGGEERRQETGLVLWLHVVLALVCLLMRQVGKVTELQSMLMGVAGLQERIPKEIPQEPCSIISRGQVGVPFATAYSVLIVRKEPLKIFWMNFFWVTVLPQPKWRGEKRQRS